MLTILVFEIKEGKNAQKINKLLTIIYHYLVGTSPPPPACMLKKALDFVCAFMHKCV
jgi:hypothetical protein